MVNNMSKKVAVIIGVGPLNGLGAQLCKRFARSGYHVFAAGRTLEKIQLVTEKIRAEGGEATGLVADATSPEAMIDLFEKANEIGTVSLSIFNAGNGMVGDFLEMEPDFFETCWRISCFGGFLFSQQAIKAMLPQGIGTLLYTSASAALRGKPYAAAFTAAKAGVRALSQSLCREFGPLGIHVSNVVIDGPIDGDRIRKLRPYMLEARGEDGLIGIQGIVDIYEMLHNQPKKAWSHEIDVRTFKEEW